MFTQNGAEKRGFLGASNKRGTVSGLLSWWFYRLGNGEHLLQLVNRDAGY